MYSLIPQILLLVGFGLILWLVIKNLPKIKDEDIEKEIGLSESKIKIDRLGKKIPIEKIDAKVNSFLEKFLRRSRIILMRIDTYLQKHLEVLKNHAKPKSIFKAEEKGIQEKIELGLKEDLEILEQEVNLASEEDIDLIAGVDKVTEDTPPIIEENKIIGVDDEVEVLMMGPEETIKKFNLEPEAEIIEEKKGRRKKKKI